MRWIGREGQLPSPSPPANLVGLSGRSDKRLSTPNRPKAYDRCFDHAAHGSSPSGVSDSSFHASAASCLFVKARRENHACENGEATGNRHESRGGHFRDAYLYLVLARGGHRPVRSGLFGLLRPGDKRAGHRQVGALVCPCGNVFLLCGAGCLHRGLRHVRARGCLQGRQDSAGRHAGKIECPRLCSTTS